jgi:hypothetical protein
VFEVKWEMIERDCLLTFVSMKFLCSTGSCKISCSSCGKERMGKTSFKVSLNQNPQNYRMNRMKFHPHSENSKILEILIQTLSSVTVQTYALNACHVTTRVSKYCGQVFLIGFVR